MEDRARIASRAALVAALLATLVGCGGGGVSSSDLQGVTLPEPTPKPDFTLTDTEGESYRFAQETQDRLTLLYFGYTECPDICPVHLAQIAETFDEIPQVATATEVVFVSIDPERDTPADIREFLDRFDQRFVGLTGTPEELAAAQEAAGVPVAVKQGEGEDYTMGHAGQVLAWAPDGLMYSQYPFGTRQRAWINDLGRLAEIEPEGAT
jgi:protein SCO1